MQKFLRHLSIKSSIRSDKKNPKIRRDVKHSMYIQFFNSGKNKTKNLNFAATTTTNTIVFTNVVRTDVIIYLFPFLQYILKIFVQENLIY